MVLFIFCISGFWVFLQVVAKMEEAADSEGKGCEGLQMMVADKQQISFFLAGLAMAVVEGLEV